MLRFILGFVHFIEYTTHSLGISYAFQDTGIAKCKVQSASISLLTSALKPLSQHQFQKKPLHCHPAKLKTTADIGVML